MQVWCHERRAQGPTLRKIGNHERQRRAPGPTLRKIGNRENAACLRSVAACLRRLGTTTCGARPGGYAEQRLYAEATSGTPWSRTPQGRQGPTLRKTPNTQTLPALVASELVSDVWGQPTRATKAKRAERVSASQSCLLLHAVSGAMNVGGRLLKCKQGSDAT